MKKLFTLFFLVLVISSQSFGQVSIKKYVSDWKSAKADLKKLYANKGVNETTSNGMTFVYYKDKLLNADVIVTYVYNSKGQLEGKMLKNSVPDKNFFDALLKEMLPLYGNNFKKSKANKFTVYTWKASASTTVSVMQEGLTTQLVCNKKKK